MKAHIKLFQEHNLEVWFEEHKERWCIYGQGGVIATCLRATRAKHIIIDGYKFTIDEVTHQIYQLAEIKIAFSKLLYE